MNYLVHLLLAGDDEGHRLGGLAGDFVKGRLDPALPRSFREGLRLHRLVDRYAHEHPACRASRERLPAHLGLLRGVIIDIAYDHFLARDWDDWHDRPLEEFAADAYCLMRERRALLPASMQLVAQRMAAMDWLTSYRDPETLAIVLERMGSRLRRPNRLAEGAAEILRHDAELTDDFNSFLRDALAARDGLIATCREKP